MEDPNPKVSGASFERLRAAGIEVRTGLLEDEAQSLNEAFSRWITTKRPYVTLKSALTLDGQLALPASGKSKKRAWITGEESRARVHCMRHASDALLTGIGTILADDPQLTDRSGLPRRRKLLRVILDTKLRLLPKSRIVKSADRDLIVYTGLSLESPKARRLQKAGVEVLQANVRKGQIDLGPLLRDLGRRDVLSVLLEAGPKLNSAALASGVVNRMVLFYAPKLAGRTDVPLADSPQANALSNFHIRSVQQIGPDFSVDLVRDP
jgi:diaminohydroxyphosphoribosylaminopyrimidine deaminase/5-amino-6-(5-phosphoribosylamino)uracil reductase